jgi:rhamnosyltransferase
MSICAIVVSYHPPAEIVDNITALLEQVDEVVIVDNGSGATTKELLGRLGCYSKVGVIYNDENVGIAAALNAGVSHAKKAGHQWVATFDQDSRVTPGMITSMMRAYDRYPGKKSVAILCPRYTDKTMGLIASYTGKSGNSRTPAVAEVLAVMTSGNLVKVDVFGAIGYFNEALFIDHVDSEFCLRCAAHGFKILEVQDAILEHALGLPVRHKFLWKTVTASNYGALRRYYSSRNRIWMYKQFALAYPGWVVRDINAFLKEIVILMLFENNRRQKLAAICRAVFHGLSGRLGKL